MVGLWMIRITFFKFFIPLAGFFLLSSFFQLIALAEFFLKLDKAQLVLEDTVKLEPTNSIAHYRLGTVYRQKGRMADAKREVELYKKYKDMKEKLRAVYKDLQIQPSEIRPDEPDEK